MCLYPISAVSYKVNVAGEVLSKVQLCKNQDLFINNNINIYYDFRKISLCCNKCFECLQQKANEWAYRIYNETQLHEESCFITLTYADEREVLSKREIQLFLKRLRKAISPKKVRFFACGEYGSKRLRPHYHLILFGFVPGDLKFLKYDKKGMPLFTSEFISNIWKKGYISVGFVSLDSAKYCAKYLQKIAEHDKRVKLLTEFFGDEKPFTLMSNRPGIGAKWFEKNSHLISSDKVYVKGHYIKLPRYYLTIAEDKLGLYLGDLKEVRKIKSSIIELNEDDLIKKRRKVNNFLANTKII